MGDSPAFYLLMNGMFVSKRWGDMEAVLGKQKKHANGTGGGPPIKDDKYTDDILDVVGERKKHTGIGKFCHRQISG